MDEIIAAWKQYADNLTDWQAVVAGTEPKLTNCGPVYEPPPPLPERTETFAVADMRNIKVAAPHYHTGGETEIYFIIQGSGLTVVGGEEIQVSRGSVVVTPPGTAHFTIPGQDLVLIAINVPNFHANNVVDLDESDPSVGFDKAQYEKLTT
jgi:mannose-6-phosphate isomerase-like protein (cupin superfamily)